jgi:hypothetical protein
MKEKESVVSYANAHDAAEASRAFEESWRNLKVRRGGAATGFDAGSSIAVRPASKS